MGAGCPVGVAPPARPPSRSPSRGPGREDPEGAALTGPGTALRKASCSAAWQDVGVAPSTIRDRFAHLLLEADVFPFLKRAIRAAVDDQYAQALADVRADPRVLPTLPVDLAAEVAVVVGVSGGPVLHRALWASDPRPEVRESLGAPPPQAQDPPSQPADSGAPAPGGTGDFEEAQEEMRRLLETLGFGGPGPRGLADVPVGGTASEVLAALCDRPQQFAGLTDELITHAARLCAGDPLTEFEVPVTGAALREPARPVRSGEAPAASSGYVARPHDERETAKALGTASAALRAVLTPAQLLEILYRPDCRDLRNRVASDAAIKISDVPERWVRFLASVDTWEGTVDALCDACATIPGTQLGLRRPWELPEGMVDYDRWEDAAWLADLRATMATTGCVRSFPHVDHSAEIATGVAPERALELLTHVPTLSRSQMAALDPWLDTPPARITPDGSGDYVAYYCSMCGPHTLHDPRSEPSDRTVPPPFVDLRHRGELRSEGLARVLYPILRWDWQQPHLPGSCCEATPGAGPLTRTEAVRSYLSLAEQAHAPHVVAMWRWVIARVAPDEFVDPWA